MKSSLPAIPSDQKVVDLFKFCIEFTARSTEFSEKNETLNRVGINAQILAASLEARGAALGVLVSEISDLAKSCSKILDELSISGIFLARSAMTTMAMRQLLSKYNESFAEKLHITTEEQIESSYNQEHQQMLSEFDIIQERFELHLSSLSELTQITVYIPSLIALLKINVAELGEKEISQQFEGTVDSLAHFRQFIVETTELMRSNIYQALALLDKLLDQ